MPPRTPHYRAVTSHLRPGSSRASTRLVRSRSIPPRACHPAGRAAALPASPVPLRSTAARPAAPANPRALRTPPPVCAVCRSLRLPCTPRPRPTAPPPAAPRKGSASGDRQSRRTLTLAPFASGLPGMRIGRPCELAGRVGSRCRLRGRRLKRCPRRVRRFRVRASLVQLGHSCGIA